MAGAHPFFSDGRGVGVVFQNHLGTEKFFDFVANRVVHEIRQIGGVSDDALVHQNVAGDAHAHACQLVGGEFFAQPFNRLDDVLGDGLAARRDWSGAGDLLQHLSFAAYRSGAQIRAAQVHSDRVVAHSLA